MRLSETKANPKQGNILPLVAIFVVLFVFIVNVDFNIDDLTGFVQRTGTSSQASVIAGTQNKLIPEYKLIPDEVPEFYQGNGVDEDFVSAFTSYDYDFVSDFERAAPDFYYTDGVDEDFVADFESSAGDSYGEYVDSYALPNDEYIQDWWGSERRRR